MFLKELNIDQLEKHFGNQTASSNMTVMMMVAEEELFFINEVIEFFNYRGIHIFGAIFPGLIYNGIHKDHGAIITTLSTACKPILCDLSKPCQFPVQPEIREVSENLQTGFVFFDGLSRDVKRFLSGLYLHYGTSVKYIGGGAGTSDYLQKPCIFTNTGLFQDAAVFCLANQNITVRSRHGWDVLKGPYLVTGSEKNRVKTINWQAASQVYMGALREQNIKVDAETIYEIAPKYPLGIYMEGHEFILRDPFQATRANELICIGEVPENTAIYILQADKQSLLYASQKATQDMLIEESNAKTSFNFISYSRSIFLGDEFSREINETYYLLKKSNTHMINKGAMTFGEIASLPSGFMELFNKSFVTGALHESTN